MVEKIRSITRNTQLNSTKPDTNHSEINQQEISSQDYIELLSANKENNCVQNANTSSTIITENNMNKAKNINNCNEQQTKRKEETAKNNFRNERECPFIYEELPVFMVKNKDYLVNSNRLETNSPMFASNLSLANEHNNKPETIRRSFGKVPCIPIENRIINKDDMVLISSSRLHSNPNLFSDSRYFSLTNPNLHIDENFPTAKNFNWSTFGLNQLNSRFYNLPNEESILSKRLVKIRNRKYSKSFKNRNKKNVANSKKIILNDSFLLNNLILNNKLNDANSLDRIFSLRLKELNPKVTDKK